MFLEILYALAACATVGSFVLDAACLIHRKPKRRSAHRRMTQEGEEVRPPTNE